ncbi:glutathione S-transferase family protein [Bradyrhizobium japonicum]|uniref:glutathione S-transferase family protein n=1 Tax=Bradyrhizobium japonicum TaxID=375 RepID=UPI0020A1A7BA|nr:glutathione S-transferase family protein [Bradyrhizobium japonicum]MCP1780814.1 glutathione S-transferase [Bradyrhizobium japonicum]MCP1956194.1 glutathione S-transferase [Bradyrhizobium japonicum]
MANLTMPRGFVRDLRVRWALEEAALPYRVASVPFGPRDAAHFAHQPFGQVPWLTDDDLSIFESGAILLHLGELSAKLMPTDPRGRSDTVEWVFAALNSVEMPALPWTMFKFTGSDDGSPAVKFVDDFLKLRLKHMETVLADHEWLAGSFSVADILMSDVLRVVDKFDGLTDSPACRDYVARATGRPAFAKAHADQMTHFAAADAKRKAD